MSHLTKSIVKTVSITAEIPKDFKVIQFIPNMGVKIIARNFNFE